ncbi:MAG: ABC transporter ATP-binding protein, partial [Chloroflexia bacterium]
MDAAVVSSPSLVRVAVLIGAVIAETTLQLVAGSLLRSNLLEHILGRPGARALPSTAGEAVSRFRDDVKVVVGFLSWTLDPVGQFIVMVVALVVLIQVDVLLTVAVFVPLLFVLATVNLAGRRIQRYRRASQQSIGEVTGLLGETFGSVQAVKSADAEERVVGYFRKVNDRRRRATVNDLLFNEVLNSVWTNSANVGAGLILLVAAQSIRSGRISVGDFALFVSYLGWLTQVTSMVGHYLAQYRQAGVSLERLTALMPGAPPEKLVEHRPIYLRGALPDPPYHPKTPSDRLDRLEVRGLTYRHSGSERGIEGVYLTIERGSFTVVTGRIGAGKTTLVRTLLGLVPLDSGEIRWNGAVVAEPAEFLVPPRAAYTPQTPRFSEESLRDNILLGLPQDRVDLQGALRLAVLERDLEDLEAGLDTIVGARGVKLSGGQRQRAAAARMYVRDAELLVFDDLSSALDVETEQTLWARLFEQLETTCLVVSHR